MDNERGDPLLNAQFRVEIEGLRGTGVVEVAFPEARIRPRSRAGKVQYGPLILRRGLTASQEWYRWWDTVRRSARVPGRSIDVVLMDRAGNDACRWTFTGALPSVYAVSPLNALHGGLVTETLELSVDGFTLTSGSEQHARTPRGKTPRQPAVRSHPARRSGG